VAPLPLNAWVETRLAGKSLGLYYVLEAPILHAVVGDHCNVKGRAIVLVVMHAMST
jgi:hypothetical protein